MSGKLEDVQEQKQSLVKTKIAEAEVIRDNALAKAYRNYEKRTENAEHAYELAIEEAEDAYSDKLIGLKMLLAEGTLNNDEFNESKQEADNIYYEAEEIAEEMREDDLFDADNRHKKAQAIAREKYRKAVDNILAAAESKVAAAESEVAEALKLVDLSNSPVKATVNSDEINNTLEPK